MSSALMLIVSPLGDSRSEAVLSLNPKRVLYPLDGVLERIKRPQAAPTARKLGLTNADCRQMKVLSMAARHACQYEAWTSNLSSSRSKSLECCLRLVLGRRS